MGRLVVGIYGLGPRCTRYIKDSNSRGSILGKTSIIEVLVKLGPLKHVYARSGTQNKDLSFKTCMGKCECA